MGKAKATTSHSLSTSSPTTNKSSPSQQSSHYSTNNNVSRRYLLHEHPHLQLPSHRHLVVLPLHARAHQATDAGPGRSPLRASPVDLNNISAVRCWQWAQFHDKWRQSRVIRTGCASQQHECTTTTGEVVIANGSGSWFQCPPMSEHKMPFVFNDITNMQGVQV